jgi:predicted amino acid-binding ACT domain protein
LLRAQPFEPPFQQHFQLLALVSAGRSGSEDGLLEEQLAFYLRLLEPFGVAAVDREPRKQAYYAGATFGVSVAGRELVEGGFVDSLMFYGRGAGGAPTASAVFGDVVDASVNLRAGTHGSLGTLTHATIRPIDETSSEYLISLDVADKPGVLHAVAGVLARNDVSVRAMEQEGLRDDARLVFITHDARESAVQTCLRELRDLDVVTRIGSLLRVIGG